MGFFFFYYIFFENEVKMYFILCSQLERPGKEGAGAGGFSSLLLHEVPVTLGFFAGLKTRSANACSVQSHVIVMGSRSVKAQCQCTNLVKTYANRDRK